MADCCKILNVGVVFLAAVCIGQVMMFLETFNKTNVILYHLKPFNLFMIRKVVHF